MTKHLPRLGSLLFSASLASFSAVIFVLVFAQLSATGKSRETLWLIASVGFTLLLGWFLSPRLEKRFQNPFWFLFSLTLYLPALNTVVKLLAHGKPTWSYLVLPLVPLLAAAFFGFKMTSAQKSKLILAGPALGLALLALAHLPFWAKILEVASTDPHRASVWLFGGLHRFAHDTLPVRDLFCQYGTLQGYVGSWLIHGSFQDTINASSLWHGLIRFIFLVSTYLVLRRLKFTRSLSALAVLWIFASQHSGNAIRGGLAFRYPSIGAYRHIFFPLILLLIAEYLGERSTRRQKRLVAGLGAACGLSMAWSTDAGLAQFAAVFLTLAVGWLLPWRKLWTVLKQGLSESALLFAVAGVAFVASLVAVYGRGFFDTQVLLQPFKILLYYVGGWSRADNVYPGDWMHYGINIVAPLWCGVTFVVCWFRLQTKNASVRTDALLQVFLALLALASEAKFYSRSLEAYWIYDSYPFVLLGAFQLRAWLGELKAPLLFALLLLGFAPMTDKGNNVFGVAGYLQLSELALPRWLNRAWPEAFPMILKTPDGHKSGYVSTPEERALVDKYSKPGERILLLSAFDYVYYVEMGKTPAYYILPYTDNYAVVEWNKTFRQTVRDAPLVILDVNERRNPQTVELLKNFETIDKAGLLEVLKRKRPDA